MIRQIAVMASGNGSNAQRIAEFFSRHPLARVTLILSNNPDAYVVKRAAQLNIPCHLFSRSTLNQTSAIPELLQEKGIHLVVLAGFLWLIPGNFIQRFPNRIINIHPALLPRFGGKGMFGMKVHESVIAARESESGITIHYVNDHYDEGQILFQARCPVLPEDTPETLAQRIHQLEYRHYPEVIEQLISRP